MNRRLLLTLAVLAGTCKLGLAAEPTKQDAIDLVTKAGGKSSWSPLRMRNL